MFPKKITKARYKAKGRTVKIRLKRRRPLLQQTSPVDDPPEPAYKG